MTLSKEILDILACPKCKGGLTLTEDGHGLICWSCRIRYPIRNHIPILRIDDAEPLSQDRDTL